MLVIKIEDEHITSFIVWSIGWKFALDYMENSSKSWEKGLLSINLLTPTLLPSFIWKLKSHHHMLETFGCHGDENNQIYEIS
jgi:hypothetical protein